MANYAQTLAFPTAEGYGKYATGGRGGDVVEVTTLEDYNPAAEDPVPGSFRWAFTQAKDSTKNKWGVWVYSWKPITIVFKVGGVIDLKADFSMNRSNVTIAGQTAPGEGICFKRYTLKFGGNENAVVRFLRSRPGDEAGAETSAMRWENGGNFIFDHCSMSWGIEETTHFSSAENFTIQWSIVSESLYSSVHKKGDRGYAAQWGGQYATYHHNLLAHHNTRSPRINGANKNDIYALVDYRNNLNYNWVSSGACYGGEWEVPTGGGFCHTNFVNSYNKPGPATSKNLNFAAPSYARAGITPTGYGKWYFNGNVMEGNAEKTADNWLAVDASGVGGQENIYSDQEFIQSDGILEDYSSYTETAENAYKSIIDNVGAIYPKRDAIDTRVIGELTGEIPIVRSEYIVGDLVTPKKGTSSGIIDTPFNLKPVDAGDDWDPWGVYPSVKDEALDSDHDGMPDVWETANGLNPNDPEDRNKMTKSGYTALEVYLNELVGEIIPLEFDNDTAIDDVNAVSKIKINASYGQLYIYSELPVTNVKIFDIPGSLVVSRNADNISVVNISKLPKGLYIAQLTTNDNRQTSLKFRKSN